MPRKTGAVFVLLLALASASPARAIVSGSISGRVTDLQGAGLDQICVHAEGLFPGQAGFTMTLADGTYILDPLDLGAYRLRFTDCDPSRGGRYETEWYDDATQESYAEPIVVGPAPVTGIDAALGARGAITGRVTDQFGEPVVGFCVARVEDGTSWGFSFTDVGGRYVLNGEHGVTYTVAFGQCAQNPEYEPYRPEWFDDVEQESQATELTTYRATEVVADAVVERTGSISGTVRDAEGNFAGGCAMAYTPDGQMASYAEAWGDRYIIGGLQSGTYYVHFRDCHVGGWVDEWYGNVSDMESATPVVVEYGYDTPDIDAVLEPTGTIAGRLTDPHGDPVQTCVSAVDPNGYPYVGASSDEDGYYHLPWVQPDVLLAFGGDCFDIAAEWWNDAPTRAEADLVHVPPATDVTGIDAVVDLSGLPGPCEDYTNDQDDDGLNDCEEFVVYGTNAFDADTDEDLFGDGFEVNGGSCGPYTYDGGSDPNDGSSTPAGPLPAAAPQHNLPYDDALVICR